MKQSPIFSKTYDLMQWLIPRTLGFPKSQRGVLARQVQAEMFGLYAALVDAGLGEEPPADLRRADASLTRLRTYLRLCHDLHLLSMGQYGYASQQAAEIGRLLGGWLRSLDGADRPRETPRSLGGRSEQTPVSPGSKAVSAA